MSDLNGDRTPDVVVANTGDDTISVLLGNGDGTLQPQTAYVVGAGPSSVAIADFNGDGMPDLAVSDSETPIKIGNPGLVSVLLNKGNGTFGNKTDYAAGYNPQSVVAVDLNGDGKPDLALATNLDTFGFVAVLIGMGDGTFQPQTTYQEGFAIYSLAAGDFNSDGFADLVVTSSQNSTVFIMAVMATEGSTCRVLTARRGASFPRSRGLYLPKAQAWWPGSGGCQLLFQFNLSFQ